MNLAQNIKQMRKALYLSQQELANEIGCTQTAISAFEVGRKFPSYETLKKLSDYAKKNKIKVTFL